MYHVNAQGVDERMINVHYYYYYYYDDDDVIMQAAPPTDLQGRSELQLCHVDHVSEEGPVLPCVQKGVQAADVPANTVLGNITVMQRLCVCSSFKMTLLAHQRN